MSCHPCKLGWPLGLFICLFLLSLAQCALSLAEPVLFVRTGTWFTGSWQLLQRFVLALWWAAHQVINYPIQGGSGGRDMSLPNSVSGQKVIGCVFSF